MMQSPKSPLPPKLIKDLERDIKTYDRVINNNKKSPEEKADAYYMKAGALVKLGKYKEAEDTYTTVININKYDFILIRPDVEEKELDVESSKKIYVTKGNSNELLYTVLTPAGERATGVINIGEGFNLQMLLTGDRFNDVRCSVLDIMVNRGHILSDNPLYFIDRAKLYVTMNLAALAEKDINHAINLVLAQKNSEIDGSSLRYMQNNAIEGLYVNTVIEKLKAVDTIKHLVKNGKIGRDLGSSLRSNVEAGSDLIMFLVNEQKKELEGKLTGVLQRLQQLEEREVLSRQEITELKEKNTELEDILNDHDDMLVDTKKVLDMQSVLIMNMNEKLQHIDELGSRVTAIDTAIRIMELNRGNGNVEEIKAGDIKNDSILERIRALENDRERLVGQMSSIVRTLEVTDIIEEAEIREQILELKSSDKAMHKYFTSLHFQLEGYFQVYQELGTGLISGNNLEDQKESKSSASNIKNIKWLGAILGKAGITMVTSAVDNYGFGAMSAIYSVKDDIGSARSKVAIDNQVTRIQGVIKSKLLNNGGDISRNEVAKLALKLTGIRKAQITQINKGKYIEQKEDEKQPQSDNLLDKFDNLLGEVKTRMIGELLNRYQTPEEKLAANDALMVLIYMNSCYQKISTMDMSIHKFITPWTLGEIEVSAQLKDTLEEIKQSATKGQWEEGRGKGLDMMSHKNIEGRLTTKYLQEKLGNLYTPQNVEIAKMLYFAMINVGVSSSENQAASLECVRKFKEYDDNLGGIIINRIATDRPEYFADNVGAIDICIEDQVLRAAILQKQNVAQIFTVTEIIYDNPILNDHEFLQQYVEQFGVKALGDLIDLMGVQGEHGNTAI